MTTLQEAHPAQTRRWNLEAVRDGLRSSSRVRYTLYLYMGSRLLFLALAALEMLVIHLVGPHTALDTLHQHSVTHPTLGSELSNWDGKWYLRMAAGWYGHWIPRHAGQYATLGFMPLYTMALWLVAEVTRLGHVVGGLIVSVIAGAIATVLIGQLAEEWWDEQRARRAIAFWCFFPGTVVFSMVYTEGLTLALVAACMILLKRRRWAWAGLCAGLSTAIAPVALSAIPVCLFAAWRELRKHGWHDREARRALIAPILSPLGAAGFAIFLWFWTGSPLADYTAQNKAWSESSTPLAVPRVFGSLIHQMFVAGVGSHGPGGIDLNGLAALTGTAFLFWGFKLMWEHRSRIPGTAWVWTVCIAVLALTSAKTPPNPRMLIVAFPAVIAVGGLLSERGYRLALRWAVSLTVVMTPITYVGLWLRP